MSVKNEVLNQGSIGPRESDEVIYIRWQRSVIDGDECDLEAARLTSWQLTWIAQWCQPFRLVGTSSSFIRQLPNPYALQPSPCSEQMESE